MSLAPRLILVLHAHLPWVRHPEHASFLEEEWLFEAIAECYVPLLELFEGLARDGVPHRVALGLSPTLCGMLDDPLLRDRARRYLEARASLCRRDLSRRDPADPLLPALGVADAMYRRALAAFERTGGDLVGAFAALQDIGGLEIFATSATHAVLPLLATEEGRRAQVRAGVDASSRYFGRRPRGFWLPECAYSEGLDRLLQTAGLDWFVVDAHALGSAVPPPRTGTAAPLSTPAGCFALARDPDASARVWSAERGYPGDPVYREFYRDYGWEASEELLRPVLGEAPGRRGIGLKLHRITGLLPLENKAPYDPVAAAARAREHAQDFVTSLASRPRPRRGPPAAIVAPFDAELFGHWWFEGPIFLDAVLRRIAEPDVDVVTATPADWIGEFGERAPRGRPAPSSWGRGGFWETWCDERNAWAWRLLHRAEEAMVRLTARYAGAAVGPRVGRLLSQAGRELLLAQSSDWLFMLSTGTASEFAEATLRAHIARFFALVGEIEGEGELPPGRLEAVEATDSVFPGLRRHHWVAPRLRTRPAPP